MANKIITKSFVFKESPGGIEGVIEGHASVFENVDNSGDRMIRGCFAKHLGKQMNDGLVHLTYNHRTVIGTAVEAGEDEHGLRVKGNISDTSVGKDVKTLIADGALRHMSIKFAVPKGGYKKNEHGGRDFTEVKLMDFSVVDWPDNEMASFTAKDYDNRLDEISKTINLIAEKLLLDPGESLDSARQEIEASFSAYVASKTASEMIAKFGKSRDPEEYPSLWVEAIYATEIIVVNWFESKYFSVPYAVSDGIYSFGEPTEVEKRISFVPRSAPAEKNNACEDEWISKMRKEIDRVREAIEIEKLRRMIKNIKL